MEAEAYAAQVHAGAGLEECARFLVANYRLGITEDEALKAIEDAGAG